MSTFKNVALKRSINNLIENVDSLEFGDIGGCSIEIVTNSPISFESYLYQGKNAESERNHDFILLKTMLKTFTE